MTFNIPVITIDGLSSSGKSTISVLLAEELGWHLLDSGILYRSLAYLTELESVDVNSEEKIHRLMNNFKLSNTNKSNIYENCIRVSIPHMKQEIPIFILLYPHIVLVDVFTLDNAISL